jgi:hypothetical protein
VFYCDQCSREYRSQPDIAGAVATDIGRQAMGGMLRNVPLFGRAIADNVVGQDPRYTNTLTPAQLASAWKQVQEYFRECPTCHQIVCLSDFDAQSGVCKEDSPRKADIAQAEAEQAAGVVKGLASTFGFGAVLKNAADAAKNAAVRSARCPKDGTLAPPGTKFCPECGSPMVQPAVDACPNCGADTRGAKFCPECGTRIERAQVAAVCPNCGAQTKGAKFCPECGTKVG